MTNVRNTLPAYISNNGLVSSIFYKISICLLIYMMFCRVFDLHLILGEPTPVGSFMAFIKYAIPCMMLITSYEIGRSQRT